MFSPVAAQPQIPVLKYIRIGEKLVVFPREMMHADFAYGKKVESAGFIFQRTNECFGRSESLNIDSTPEIDNELLRRGAVIDVGEVVV